MLLRSLTFAVAAVAMAAVPAGAMSPRPTTLPAGAVVIAEGQSVALEGTLKVQNLEGRHAFLTNFTRPVYQRFPVRVPMMHRPGMPRPSFFAYREVTQIAVSSATHDLLALAHLLGTTARVKVTGTCSDSPRMMTLVLQATKVQLRRHEVPANLPSEQRLIALAKKAVREYMSHSADTHLVGELKAKYVGGLRVRVTGRITGHYPHASEAAFLYDGLTGEVTVVGTPE